MDHVSALLGPGLEFFICAMTLLYVPGLIHMRRKSNICVTTHSHVPWPNCICHDSFIRAMIHSYVTWLMHMCHDTFMCAMTHSYVPWLNHMYHDSFMCGIHMRHDSYRWPNEQLCDKMHAYVCDAELTWRRTHTHTYVWDIWLDTSEWVSRDTHRSESTHGGDQTWNVWICRSTGVSGNSFEWKGLPFTFCENLFEIYWDSCENLLFWNCWKSQLFEVRSLPPVAWHTYVW